MIIRVVAAIIRREARILIVKRPDSAEMGGLWEFPGGKVEAGESDGEALARELREELDISVTIGDLFVTAEYNKNADTLVQLLFYNCEIFFGTPTLLWGQDYRWVFPAELSAYNFPPADAELVLRLAGET